MLKDLLKFMKLRGPLHDSKYCDGGSSCETAPQALAKGWMDLHDLNTSFWCMPSRMLSCTLAYFLNSQTISCGILICYKYATRSPTCGCRTASLVRGESGPFAMPMSRSKGRSDKLVFSAHQLIALEGKETRSSRSAGREPTVSTDQTKRLKSKKFESRALWSKARGGAECDGALLETQAMDNLHTPYDLAFPCLAAWHCQPIQGLRSISSWKHRLRIVFAKSLAWSTWKEKNGTEYTEEKTKTAKRYLSIRLWMF